MSDRKFVVSSTPHIRSSATIESIMRDVVIALVPAALAATYFFGVKAAFVITLCIFSCIVFEFAFLKLSKQTVTINDLSAVVTGLLLAMNLPVSVPFWLIIVGSFVAIVVVKQLFGGLGQNFMNPALAARAFLQTAYPTEMVTWLPPINNLDFFTSDATTAATAAGVEATTSATPLIMLKYQGLVPTQTDYFNAFFGNTAGSLGETCAAALLIGAAYLFIRKIINWRIPVTYFVTFGILTFIFGREGLFTGVPFYEILIGGFMIGGFFMATDYSSSPITPNGQLIMGVGCGILTFVIRRFGGYPEGVCYSILLMNLVVPLIDRYTRSRVYGVSRGGGKRG